MTFVSRETIATKIVVVGAGHAGCEAALAVSRLGSTVVLLTLRKDRLAWMPCNPSIGGLAKGHLVKEIDALGGEMGLAADCCGIQFRTLNSQKGPAVRGTRAQIDKLDYHRRLLAAIEAEKNIQLLEGEAIELTLGEDPKVLLRLRDGRTVISRAAVITAGTFLNGIIHIGHQQERGGRDGEPAAIGLSESLQRLGFELRRLKTGTVPRLEKSSIDFSRLSPQPGDNPPRPFSFLSRSCHRPQVSCYITYTNPQTHQIIRRNLSRSALYGGQITGRGPRYCPSIEDKVVRFAERERHQIFLEPEGIDHPWIYPSGISNSLPLEVQEEMIHSIEGLEQAVIARPGYAIEYDAINPQQLSLSLSAKAMPPLFFAGQINGTSGYEEAAAQGLLAGINAHRQVAGEEPLLIRRSEAYLGVMVDDLTTLGVDEPYRMFTSRAEHRLLLREDNADQRLTEIGRRIGLVSRERYGVYHEKWRRVETCLNFLRSHRPAAAALAVLEKTGVTKGEGRTWAELLQRPEITTARFVPLIPLLAEQPAEVLEQIDVQFRYYGYIEREEARIAQMRELEDAIIPAAIDYRALSGLTTEVKEKLSRVQPHTLGQASRISGVTPAAISILMIYLKRGLDCK